MRHTLAVALLLAALPVSTSTMAQQATLIQIPWGERLEGLATDPLGIWSDDELAESQVYTRQWIINGEVETAGGKLTVSMLVGDLCSLKECPLRVVREVGDDLQPVLPLEQGAFQFEMVCQTIDQIFIAADGSAMRACGADIPLSNPS